MTTQYKHSDTFIFEPETFRLVLETKEIKLSHKESAVLQQLCENAMRVVDRRTMLTDIWGDSESSDISLNKTILQLRRKFESIGISSAIDTIPRVGYMLKLPIEILQGDSLAHREEILEVHTEDLREESTEITASTTKNHGLKRGKHVIATAVTLLTFLFAFITVKLGLLASDSQQAKPDILIDKPNNQEQGRTLLYAENVSESDHDKYMALSKYVNENLSYYAIASKSALSFINLDDKRNKIWQKTFLMDPKREISTQIKCIANYINDYKAQPIEVKKIPGMSFVRLNFYSPCGADDSFLGYLIIKSTATEQEVSTWTQDLSFIDKNGEHLFHLKRFSRARQYSKYMLLNIKSFQVDYVNQEALQINSNINYIFNQFTQDEISLKTIDKGYEIYASSVFGGILFHVDRF
ncbi:winged helix-turn-helix domain-containing protein [Vibrio cholerae]|uniref:winged helix-turn-helix domain-containing protein n=1 Tax=Vibrio cholerae TaxID=666 RepID=UPI0006E60643|nr:winged helix-turn-helix domain-containing protein [Vibrio cholerae]KQA40384.1 transcriptional regulator [Vibrio cholerae]KQA45100.1 transcriptional regulator [Vibrio cholerae]KQA57260.1 transcriptional regulator [Vibrio cholerae]KQA72230.1 transcriptional regulator [Vibrio cholerae]KQA80470.1 transcriptional regulator [Vibrio cholerae]